MNREEIIFVWALAAAAGLVKRRPADAIAHADEVLEALVARLEGTPSPTRDAKRPSPWAWLRGSKR